MGGTYWSLITRSYRSVHRGESSSARTNWTYSQALPVAKHRAFE